MNLFKKYLTNILLGILAFFGAMAQPGISGPLCVTPGIAYQYVVNAPYDSSSPGRICIENGVFMEDSSSGCTALTRLLVIRVVWNMNSPNGSISYSSSDGNANLSVRIVQTLNGGLIDSSVSVQTLASKSLPATIICSPAIGGSCSPQYSYQWQQSSDQLAWTDIPGETGVSLPFSGGVSGLNFYRRRVMEAGSGSVAYSTIAVVVVEESSQP